MPSRKKTVMFASAFFTSIWSFVIVCLVLASKNWVSSNVNFTEGNSSAIVSVTYGVFEGVCSKKVIGGLETPATNFQVTAKLGKAEMRGLNIVIILFLVLSLLSSLISAGFTCCNTVSNPYQTFLGPIGVYTWNSLSGIFVLLTMILFAANIEANKLSVELASNCVFSSSSQYQNSKNSYGYAYWLMFLIFLLNVATIIIIVFYHRARYSKRKEQERPIENAPKDGILF